MSFSDPRLAASVLCAIAYASSLWRVHRIGAGNYAWFSALRVANILAMAACFFPYGSDVYMAIWRGSRPVLNFLAVLAVLELWRMTMNRYPGINRIFNTIIPVFIGTSVVISLLCGADILGYSQLPTLRHALYIADRVTGMAVGVFCALLALFIHAYREPIKRNAQIHAVLLALEYSSIGIGLLVILLTGNTNIGGLISIGNATIANFVRCWLMTAAGEVDPILKPTTEGEIRAAQLTRDAVILAFRRGGSPATPSVVERQRDGIATRQ